MASRTDPDIGKQVVDRIIARQAELRLTLKELAALSGIEGPTLSKLLNGQRGMDLKYLGPISDALDVPLAALVGREEMPHQPVRSYNMGDLNRWFTRATNDFARDALVQVQRAVEDEVKRRLDAEWRDILEALGAESPRARRLLELARDRVILLRVNERAAGVIDAERRVRMLRPRPEPPGNRVPRQPE